MGVDIISSQEMVCNVFICIPSFFYRFLGLYRWATAYCLTGRVVSRLPYIKFHRRLQVLPAGLKVSCSLALSRSWRISHVAGTAPHPTLDAQFCKGSYSVFKMLCNSLPPYSSRDILRFDKKFLCNFVCLHNFQVRFYAFCFLQCPLLKGERHAPLYSPVFKKFFQTSYECTIKEVSAIILLCSITINETKIVCEKSLTSHSFHDKIESVIS